MLNDTTNSRTLIASFPDRESASRALDRLLGIGFSSEDAWLVDRAAMNEEDMKARTEVEGSELKPRKAGFMAFVERLFGMESEPETAASNPLSKHSEHYLSETYHSERPLLVVVAPPARLGDARTILAAEGATIDEEANQFINEDVARQRTLRLHAEELVAHKEQVAATNVQIRKEVVTETRTIEVPVSHEELVIERRPLTGQEATPGESIAATADDTATINMRLMEEQVVVEKKTVPTEEITLSKRNVQGTTKVVDDVRHEEARIERQPAAAAMKSQKGKVSPEKRPGA